MKGTARYRWMRARSGRGIGGLRWIRRGAGCERRARSLAEAHHVYEFVQMAASGPNLLRHLQCALGGVPRVLRIALCHCLYAADRLADVFDSARLILAAACDLAHHFAALVNGIRYVPENGMRDCDELKAIADVCHGPLDDIRAASCGSSSALGQ